MTGDAVSVCPDITTGMTSSGPADVEWLLESRRRVSRVVDFIPPGPVSRTLHNYMKTFKLRPALLLLMLVGCSELQSAHACDSAVIAVTGRPRPTPGMLGLRLVAAMVLLAPVRAGEVDCAGMKLKALRQWLAARGLKCDGCAEKADYVALCNQNKDAPLVEALKTDDGKPSKVRTPGDAGGGDTDINELLKSMKGMPGMENVKMFTPDDLKNLNPDDWNSGNAAGSAKQRKPTQAEVELAARRRKEARDDLIGFYKTYGLDDKIDGVDAAMSKWKGRDDKMMQAVRKKYAAEVEAYEERQEQKTEL